MYKEIVYENVKLSRDSRIGMLPTNYIGANRRLLRSPEGLCYFIAKENAWYFRPNKIGRWENKKGHVFQVFWATLSLNWSEMIVKTERGNELTYVADAMYKGTNPKLKGKWGIVTFKNGQFNFKRRKHKDNHIVTEFDLEFE